MLFYEKKIVSLSAMMQELSALDLDGGVRSTGRFKARKCFVFVTKSNNGYTAALYSIKTSGKESFPDKRLLVREFGGLQDVEAFLSGVLSKPVKAFAY